MTVIRVATVDKNITIGELYEANLTNKIGYMYEAYPDSTYFIVTNHEIEVTEDIVKWVDETRFMTDCGHVYKMDHNTRLRLVELVQYEFHY